MLVCHTAQPRIAWAEVEGSQLEMRLEGVEPEAIDLSTQIEIATRDGVFSLKPSRNLESDDGTLVLRAHIPANCLIAMESTATVSVRLARVDRSFIWVRGLILVPEDISSPSQYKRARKAYHRIQQGDAENDDVVALLAFVQQQ
jgi:hypothetical protein